MEIKKTGNHYVIRMGHEDTIQLAVPASMEMTCVYLEVSSSGKLNITGGSSVVEHISGPGFKNKIRS